MAFVIIIIAFFTILSNQPLLMFTALLSFFAVSKLFWRDNEPKVLFFALAMFWLTITVKLFYAIYAGVPYESLSNSANIIDTTYSALFAFVFFSLGIYITTNKTRSKFAIDFKDNFGYSPRRMIIIYAGSIAGSLIIRSAFGMIRGFDQIVFGIIDLKMGFLIFPVLAVYQRRDNLPFAVALILFEVVLSFFSYFSWFKEILFALLILLLTRKINFNYKSLVAYTLILFSTLYLLVSWQMIKDEYRAFLNKGERAQVVSVTREEALDKLQELASADKKDDKKDKVLYASIDRLSYIEFYSESRMKVPVFMPYENGKLWAANIAHILLPRMFFPDKEPIDDSKMVNKYCFRKVLTQAHGVSMSLGFIAESYIDFGPVFMYIIIFLVGCFMGLIYASIMRQCINDLWAYAMVLPLYMKISCNGTPGTKILGWMITYYIAFIIFRKFLMNPIDRYLRTGSFYL